MKLKVIFTNTAKNILKKINYLLVRFLGISLSVQRTGFRYNYNRQDSKSFSNRHLNTLNFTDKPDKPGEVIILIPIIGSDSGFFAGLRMIIALTVELLEQNCRVRLVVTNEKGDANSSNKALDRIIQYFPSANLSKLEINFLNESCPISKNDILITTAWWTWYCADSATRTVKKIFYFIQDFEPGFYPWGSEYALALNTYSRSFVPIFSSSYLKEFFIDEGYQFAHNGLKYDLYLDREIFYPPSLSSITKPERKRKIFFYGRQSTPRNLFETAIQSLALLTQEYPHLLEGWEIVSAGQPHEKIELPNNFKIESVGKLSMQKYGELLRTSDVGLSLMLSPHPSYPPLEMVSSGLIVVTNNYANKNLSLEFNNIISTEPDSNSLMLALRDAIIKSQNFDERLKMSEKNRFCSDRKSSFKDAVDRIKRTLEVPS